MSKSSLMACSLEPAYFHHWRSKARISRSRALSPSSDSWRCGCAVAWSVLMSPSRCGRALCVSCVGSGHTLDRNDKGVIQIGCARHVVGPGSHSLEHWPHEPLWTHLARPFGGGQDIVSRMALTSSFVVCGLTMAKRVSVSPRKTVGTTKAN